MNFRACAIVPSFNHHRVIGQVVDRLCALGLPVFVLDDGSEPRAAAVLAALYDPARGVRVVRSPVNRGKGRAVCEGFRLAQADGFTHAIQVDADGQHDLAAVPRLLALAQDHPQALVTGQALFDRSVPLGRRIGRWITHAWVFVETLSLCVTDSMCGLRVYPLAATVPLIDAEPVGSRMDFDTEILVRLSWRGVPIAMVPVRVIYPPDNISNFRLLADNWRITRMHTRLVLSMPWRLLTGRFVRTRRVQDPADAPAPAQWAGLAELGAYYGIWICVAVYRLFGRRLCLAVAAPVVLYFYIIAGERRRSSRAFLQRAFDMAGDGRRATWRDGLRHFLCFADRMLDCFVAWTGRMPPDAVQGEDQAALDAFAADPRGAVVIVSHLGNTDVSRAQLDPATRRRLVVLMHTAHAANYNRMLRETAPEAAVNVLQVTDIGPDTAIRLREHVERGDWVVIAGDRTPVRGEGRVVRAPFLGRPAPFSQGPYVLAALLECPVWLLFCRKVGDRYRLTIERFADPIVLPRGARQQALADCAARYADRLATHTLADPFQWYNFYDFWAERTAV
jgi:predicted LPLAT superfamily acyltransferase